MTKQIVTVLLCCLSGSVCAAESAKPRYQLDLEYAGELWRNSSGGVELGSRYVDRGMAALSVDAEQVLNLTGTDFFISAIYTNGQALAEPLVGAAQGISNIEADRAVRVLEAWGEWHPANVEGSLKFGLYDLNSEFDVTQTASLFLNPSHGIGVDFAQSGLNAPSIFPVTSLALRGQLKMGDWTYQLAVLDAVPGHPAHAKRTTIKLDNDEGLLSVAEVQRDFTRLHFGLGYWRYSAQFDDVLRTNSDSTPFRHRGNAGYYFIAETKLPEEGARGLTVFLRYGGANEDFNTFKRYTGVGANYTGLLPGRTADVLGVALAAATAGQPYLDAEINSDKSERIYELTYQAAINDWLTVQPDVQYVQNPGLSASLEDDWVFGVRVTLATQWTR